MKPVLITLCCFSVVYTEASEILEVSGHVGGDVTIPCFGSRIKGNSSEHNSMYFCKGVCSSEDAIIQAETKRSAVTQKGRYRMGFDEEDGVFIVVIKHLSRADSGRYLCGMKKRFNVSHQEVNLRVEDGFTVPPGSLPSLKPNQEIDEVTLPQSSFSSSTKTSTETFTPAPSEKSQQEVNDLTDTMVVIIVSGSMAFLVCAIIPLIFYKHWCSNAGQNRPAAIKADARHCEENVVEASTQVEMGLQSLEQDPPESSTDDYIQYAAIYEGLDPKTVD